MSDQRLQLRADRIEWRLVDDEIVAVDLAKAVYFAVTGAGPVLWERLVAGTNRAALIEAIVCAFDVDDKMAAADVDAFIDDLRARGMLADGVR